MHLQACHLPWPLYVAITRYALAKLGAAESRSGERWAGVGEADLPGRGPAFGEKHVELR